MRKLFPVFIVLLIAAVAFNKYQRREQVLSEAEAEAEAQAAERESRQPQTLVEYESDGEGQAGVPDYRCDGREYCSQMTSCKEALWFIAHCPDMKMDGDHDGIPCETQWCSHLR
ncbi:MAG TPA: excalibur calcium-binding domain-containing protein [Steroidobacteraceae bacterium]|jgi:hypothetical protein